MARRQSRRSVSMRAEVFVRLHDYTRATDQADSAVVEKALAEYLDRHGVPDVTREEAILRLRRRLAGPTSAAPASTAHAGPIGDDEIEDLRRRAFG